MYRNGIKRLLAVILSLCGMIVLSPLLAHLSALPSRSILRGRSFSGRSGWASTNNISISSSSAPCASTPPHDMPTHMLKDPDQYITRVGHFLRKTSLDELPQLWNIFVGDMAVIGPRPALWNQYDLLAERDKYGANDVRPGLTGWAQIHGRDELEIVDKARLDGYYVEHLSFGMDVKCFFGTIRAVLDHDGVVEGGTALCTKRKTTRSKTGPGRILDLSPEKRIIKRYKTSKEDFHESHLYQRGTKGNWQYGQGTGFY